MTHPRKAFGHPHLMPTQVDRLNAAAAQLNEPEKKSLFFGRVSAALRARGNLRPSDHDVDVAIEAALRGLRQQLAEH